MFTPRAHTYIIANTYPFVYYNTKHVGLCLSVF